MELRKIFGVALGFGLLGVVAGQAHAGSVTLNAPSDFGTFLKPGVTDIALSFTANGHTQTYGSGQAGVGEINWTVGSSSDGAFTLGQNVSSFCIQAFQDVNNGAHYTFDVHPFQAGQPAGLTSPDDGILDSTSVSGIQKFVNAYFNDISDAKTAAAFQLGIWELEYDGGLGNALTLGSGNFSASGSDPAINLANNWLSNLGTAAPTGHYSILALTSPSAQDQIVIRPAAVPLPAALPAGLLLMAGVFGASKLRRKLA